MDDLISRQAVIDAVENVSCSDGYGISVLKCEAIDDAVRTIRKLPSAQSEEAIPVAWLEEQAKWFESMDNAFAKIEANNIRVMIKKWRRENGRFNQQTGGD